METGAGPQNPDSLSFVDADRDLVGRLVAKLNAPGRHRLGESEIHLDDGFTIVAMAHNDPIAVISIALKPLPWPVPDATEAYIDLVDVDPQYRRRGIGRQLIELATSRARDEGASQIRAWTSAHRTEAIIMWHRLGFSMCPAEIVVGRDAEHVRGMFAVKALVTQKSS